MKTIHISQRTSVKYKMSYKWWGGLPNSVKQSKEWLILWGPQPVLHSTLSPLTFSVKITKETFCSHFLSSRPLHVWSWDLQSGPQPQAVVAVWRVVLTCRPSHPILGWLWGVPQPKHDPEEANLGQNLEVVRGSTFNLSAWGSIWVYSLRCEAIAG